MRELIITSAQELIDLVQQHGIVLTYHENTIERCITTQIITGIYEITESYCLFKTLKFGSNRQIKYLVTNMTPNENDTCTVQIPDEGKRFVAIPRCILGRLEQVIVSSLIVPPSVDTNKSHIVHILEVDTNYAV